MEGEGEDMQDAALHSCLAGTPNNAMRLHGAAQAGRLDKCEMQSQWHDTGGAPVVEKVRCGAMLSGAGTKPRETRAAAIGARHAGSCSALVVQLVRRTVRCRCRERRGTKSREV